MGNVRIIVRGKKRECKVKKIITGWSKLIPQKRLELWGFQPLSPLWSHLGPKQQGFVGSEDEQKTHFPSWLHLPLRIYTAAVLRSGRQMWSNMKGNGEWETRRNREGVRTKKQRTVGSAEGNIARWYGKGKSERILRAPMWQTRPSRSQINRAVKRQKLMCAAAL